MMTVWYDKELEAICLVDKKLRVWFRDDMFYKLYNCRREQETRIKTKIELHEKLWESGLEYIGEFE